MTWSVLALVNVDTLGRSCDKTLSALALVVDAHLVGIATSVRMTTNCASSIDTKLAWQTVAIAVTDFRTNSSLASFALGAVVVFATLALALA